MNFLTQLLTETTSLYVTLRMAIILAITFAVSKIVAAATKKIRSQKLHYRFAVNITNVLIWLAGVVFALGQMPGFDRGLEYVLAGSGIAALAISLAAQESLGNAINGMVISFSKPFEVGDRVHLVNGNITGYVEDITLRHTVVRTFMNSRLIIPNSVINKDMIENSNFQQARASAFIDVIIPYEADMERAREIMAEVLAAHPDYVDPRTPEEMHTPKVMVYVRALGVYGVELRASMWTEHIGLSFAACSEVRRQIKLAFDKEGIPFATGVLAPPPTA